jgi:drug/metabolite transporter (DMT)-like permease
VTNGGPGSGRRLTGYLQALAAATLWGSSGVFAVQLFRLGLSPDSVALLRPLIGVVVLGLFVAVRSPRALYVDGKGLLLLAGLGGVTIGIFQIAYMRSTDAVGVPSTVALLYVAPAWVVAISGPLLGEWPDRVRLLLLAVTLMGVWLTVFGANDVEPLFGKSGVAWGVTAGTAYAAYTLFGRYAARRYGAMPTVVYSSVGACVVLGLTAAFTAVEVQWPSSGPAWAWLTAFAVLTIAVAHSLFFAALTRIDAAEVSISAAIEPVVAAVLATIALQQGLAALGWLGIGLVVLGVGGIGRRSRSRPARSRDPAR